MTKTRHITHSAVFLRMRNPGGRAQDERAARQLLVAHEAAQDALAALFDGIDDFDDLVRECIPTLEIATEPVRRERGSADRSASAGRGRVGNRAATRNAPASTRPASSRR